MGVGTGIFLIVVGAILAFAVGDSVEGVDLSMVGWICIAAGVVALIVSLIMNQQRTNTKHHVVEEHYEGRTNAPPPID